jgi:hypothetical protein
MGSGLVEANYHQDQQSCHAAGLCCQGKNLTCRVFSEVDRTGNSVELGKVERPAMCFCDEACLELGDCCHDYKTACEPIDCLVAEDWGPWGECDARCGPGVRQRTRRIFRSPKNGGKPCPKTNERIACEGTQCKVARAPEGHDELRETAKIIPASFGGWRSDVKYDPFRDIRRNLFERYQRTLKVDRPTYCMKFEFTEVWPACSVQTADNPTAAIVKGNTVCVECQPLAMKKSLGSRCKGHGAMMRETRWKAVLTSGCHGKWVLKSRQDDCECQSKNNDSDFILL